jgi:hypothetical protein
LRFSRLSLFLIGTLYLPVASAVLAETGSSAVPTRVALVKPRRGPAMCVIDDSRDMVGVDGFSMARNREVPILFYLLPALRCQACCYWSAFRVDSQTGAVTCAPPPRGAASCDVNDVREATTLTMTSPLVREIDRVEALSESASEFDRDVYFITNGIDWPQEGADTHFKTEMDVSKDLVAWLSSGSTKDLVFGAAQDDLRAKRRPADVLGFMDRPVTVGGCEVPVDNVPSDFTIKLNRYENPASAVLTDGTLGLRPSLELSLGKRTVPFQIGLDGTVRVNNSIAQRVQPGDYLGVGFLLPKADAPRPCWDFEVRTNNDTLLPMQCDETTDALGHLGCRLDLDKLPDLFHRGGKLSFQLAPTVPRWLAALAGVHHRNSTTLSEHSLLKTFAGFRTAIEQSRAFEPKLKLNRNKAVPINAIVVQVVMGK